MIAAILERTGLPATRLRLEITESTIMADPVRAMRVLQPLADMGVRLSIDDYMTQPQAKPVTEVVLSGPGSSDHELVESLQRLEGT